jgi:G:T-mismatch repair DNA endonuclease (very short patch repair protein)
MNKAQREKLRLKFRFMNVPQENIVDYKLKGHQTKVLREKDILAANYKVGDIVEARKIGYSDHGAIMTWDVCPKCGKERWVRRHIIGHPCHACTNAIINSNPEVRKLRSEREKGRPGRIHTPEEKEKNRQAALGHVNSPEHREKNRQAMLRQWRDPILREGLIKRFTDLKPNRIESKFDAILQKYFSNEWRYTGNFDIVIGGRCPDWSNCNGVKAVLLLHGIYWHLKKYQKENPSLTKEQVEIDDIKHYKEFGFDCLIIWEDELKDEVKLVQKVNQFSHIKKSK